MDGNEDDQWITRNVDERILGDIEADVFSELQSTLWDNLRIPILVLR